ncbi:MAG: DUF1963 domain-containing protein, partial [Ruminococcus sp.]|nr:DUF1963 domain-containing protein [Ruminococcus sp.]
MPELIDKLIKDGHTETAEELKKYYHNAVYLTSKEYPDSIPVGASKCGGFPDLPPEIDYPTMSEYTLTWLNWNKGKVEHYEKSAMQLMAQINLYELAESGADLENLLPKTGMIYIFWSGETMKLENNKGFEFIIKESDKTATHKIIYWDGDMSTLKRTGPPCRYYSKYFDEYDKCFSERAVEFDSCEEYKNNKNHYFNNKLFGFPQGFANQSQLDKTEINLFQFDCYDIFEGAMWEVYWIMKKSDLK